MRWARQDSVDSVVRKSKVLLFPLWLTQTGAVFCPYLFRGPPHILSLLFQQGKMADVIYNKPRVFSKNSCFQSFITLFRSSLMYCQVTLCVFICFRCLVVWPLKTFVLTNSLRLWQPIWRSEWELVYYFAKLLFLLSLGFFKSLPLTP